MVVSRRLLAVLVFYSLLAFSSSKVIAQKYQAELIDPRLAVTSVVPALDVSRHQTVQEAAAKLFGPHHAKLNTGGKLAEAPGTPTNGGSIEPNTPADCTAGGVTIDMIPIGNPWNPDAPFGYGRVTYAYEISRAEISNEAYARFLNAVVQGQGNDPYRLFKPESAHNPRQGIRRGSNFCFEPNPLMADKPATYISFFDTIRFANWMTNGQPVGQGITPQTTEDGMYDLSGYDPDDPAVLSFLFASISQGIRRRDVDSVPFTEKWLIPTLDEWYKAAFYDPATQTYSLYSSGTSASPAAGLADAFGYLYSTEQPDNFLNYKNTATWIPIDPSEFHQGTYTAPTSTPSHYDGRDFQGNLLEWLEDINCVAQDDSDLCSRRFSAGWYGTRFDFMLNVYISPGVYPGDPEEPPYNAGYRVYGDYAGIRLVRIQ